MILTKSPEALGATAWPLSDVVDKKTGDVYKAASFKAPAKHVRFNLCIISDREWLLENADWAGSYLYM